MLKLFVSAQNAKFHMVKAVRGLVTNESGATAIEYGLIAALISVGIITAVTTVGTDLTKTFEAVSAKLVQ